MKKVYILAFVICSVQSACAQIRDFQTTRLNSTGGAGIASVLSTEAALLNPAASAFFNGSSVSYQSYSTSLRKESDDRKTNNDDFPSHNKSQGFFLSDHDGPVKGGIAYLKQNENNFERQQLIAHGAAPLSESASMGFSYKYIDDTRAKRSHHSVSHQSTIGITQILDDKTIVGLVLIDPMRTTPNEERLMAGFQYAVADKLNLIGDVGTQYTKDVRDKYIWRVATQLQLFDDFFFRIGKFYDNVRENKGTGWGVGWVGPKLGIEFAQKITDQFGKHNYVYKDETLVDTSISAIIKF